MSPGSLTFYLNGEERTLSHIRPVRTLLDYLREDEGLCGTKQGCAEGDCGACTVTVASRAANGGIKREAVNACIRFMPSVHGTAITTVEALSSDKESAHPVQQAMIDRHGSQCGFCTPGFVMSLYTAYRNRTALAPQSACDVLAGNLCRCTGYGPILAAASDMSDTLLEPHHVAQQDAADTAEQAALDAVRPSQAIEIGDGQTTAFLPTNTDELAQIYADRPNATIVAGATDVGLWVTKQHRALPETIFLHLVDDLKRITQDDTGLTIGAGVTYSEAMQALTAFHPDFGELLRRIGGVQVRNAGTIGGNIANGSPIGDTPPILIALGATLSLRHGNVRREMPLEQFFLEYGRQARKPGEFVEAIFVPNLADDVTIKCYKISKRFDQDISAVCAAFAIACEGDRVTRARIAYGGMAGVPKRALAVEAALEGKPWSRETVEAAMQAYAEDFSPLTDMRASADYRLMVAKNLLLKAFLETQTGHMRLVGHGSVFA